MNHYMEKKIAIDLAFYVSIASENFCKISKCWWLKCSVLVSDFQSSLVIMVDGR